MLKEADIDRHSRWSDVKRKVDNDPRYKIVESGVQREDWFRDYMIKVRLFIYLTQNRPTCRHISLHVDSLDYKFLATL